MRGFRSFPDAADPLRAQELPGAVRRLRRVAGGGGVGGRLPHPARGRPLPGDAGRHLRRPPRRRRDHPSLRPPLRDQRHHRPGLRPRRRRPARGGLRARRGHGPRRLGGGDVPEGRLARDLRHPLLRVVLQLALRRPHAGGPGGGRSPRRPRPQPGAQRAALGRLLHRRPGALPDPLPGEPVPGVDARAADGDPRRARHRPPFPVAVPGRDARSSPAGGSPPTPRS